MYDKRAEKKIGDFVYMIVEDKPVRGKIVSKYKIEGEQCHCITSINRYWQTIYYWMLFDSYREALKHTGKYNLLMSSSNALIKRKAAGSK